MSPFRMAGAWLPSIVVTQPLGRHLPTNDTRIGAIFATFCSGSTINGSSNLQSWESSGQEDVPLIPPDIHS